MIFFGFTHYCGKSRNGKFRVKRRTSREKLKAKIKEMNIWIKRHRNIKVRNIIAMINIKLRGYYGYYGVKDNYNHMEKFRHNVNKLLWKWLNRRSQKRSYTKEEFAELMKQLPLLRPKIYVEI